MRFIYSNSSDASFNLASEEYFLKHFEEDVFFTYINSQSIVSGKHQNTMGEINFEYTQSNNIGVFRRLSGGGTVYHDFGNVNFCFITNEKSGDLVNFEKYLKYIVRFLATKGVKAEIGSRHELTVDGKKISGNASHIYKTRVMHHGTLLFESELDILNECIKITPERYKDKAVKSVRSVVTNISEYLEEKITTEEFSKELFEWLQGEFDGSHHYILTDVDKQYIDDLNRTKFSTDKWIYGYSPQYFFEKRVILDNGYWITVKMDVQKGIISSVDVIQPENNANTNTEEFVSSLVGVLHSKNDIEQHISKNEHLLTNTELTRDKLIELLF